METVTHAAATEPEAQRASALTADDACVVIPMHNEATVIGDVLAGLRPFFEAVICVDDGSHDRSAVVAKTMGANVVRHATNLGQGAALQTGIAHALRATPARHIVTFDADGQHAPGDAFRMVQEACASGVDVVLGSRFLNRETSVPGARRALLKGAVAFTRATTGLRLSDTHNGLRVLTRHAAEELEIHLNGMAHASELLQQVASRRLRYLEVPVTVSYTEYSRAKGQSGLNALNIMFDLFLHRVTDRTC